MFLDLVWGFSAGATEKAHGKLLINRWTYILPRLGREEVQKGKDKNKGTKRAQLLIHKEMALLCFSQTLTRTRAPAPTRAPTPTHPILWAGLDSSAVWANLWDSFQNSRYVLQKFYSKQTSQVR